MPDSEFLTVVSYRDAIVPEWISSSDGLATRAFKAGVDAAYNVECKGSCAKPPATQVTSEDPEPPRNQRYSDSDGDLWGYEEGQWGYKSRLSDQFYGYGTWENVVHEFSDGMFPLVRVG